MASAVSYHAIETATLSRLSCSPRGPAPARYGSNGITLTNLPWFSVLGNHEYGYNVQAQLDMAKIYKTWVLDDRCVPGTSSKGDMIWPPRWGASATPYDAPHGTAYMCPWGVGVEAWRT